MTRTPRDTPILMSAPMVKATLADRKRITRRAIGKGNCEVWCDRYELNDGKIPADVALRAMADDGMTRLAGIEGLGYIHIPCRPHPNDPQSAGCWTRERVYPRWHPGDRLWVRETWRSGIEWDDTKPGEIDPLVCSDVWYEADGVPPHDVYTNPPTDVWGKCRPSIFMPRWASRITLEVLSVRAERLHDITEDEAAAEGLPAIENPDYDPEDPCDDVEFSHVAAFAALWDEINGKGAWDANPFCWRIEFRRVDHA